MVAGLSRPPPPWYYQYMDRARRNPDMNQAIQIMLDRWAADKAAALALQAGTA